MGLGAVARMATRRLACAAWSIRLLARLTRCDQSGAAAHPLSIRMRRGPPPARRSAGRHRGLAMARTTRAAMERRSSNNHQGVWAGVSVSGLSSSSSLIAGKRTRLGAGGVTRSSHQMIGRESRPSSAQGAAKANGPSDIMAEPRCLICSTHEGKAWRLHCKGPEVRWSPDGLCDGSQNSNQRCGSFREGGLDVL